MNKYNLSQFKGESNPYDTLWYLSIEIGRGLLFKALRIGSGINDGCDCLLEKYNEVYNKVTELSEEEREFLLKDSYFSKCDFYRNENKKLMDIEKEPASIMSVCSQLVSKEFLMATLGEDKGADEYNRRCKLASIGKRYKNKFLYEVMEYIDGCDTCTDGVKEFIKVNFEEMPSVEDIQLMIDVNDTGKRFYNEE